MRFVTQYPGHAWWNIAVTLISEMVATYLGTGPLRRPEYGAVAGSRFIAATPDGVIGALNNLIEVADRAADVGMTTPTAAAVMAYRGTGPFTRPHPQLRAVASYPHDDYLVFLADSRFGTSSLREFLHIDQPVTVVTGRRGADGTEDVVTYVVHEVLRRHGAGFADIDARAGSSVVFGGNAAAGGQLLLRGEGDALFHEAQAHPVWRTVVASRPMTVLYPDSQVLVDIAGALGLTCRDIPAGHQVGNESPVPTLDFSGWLLFVHEDMPDDHAYALALACDRTRAAVEQLVPDRSISKPIDPHYMFTEVGIPLHPGAARYAEAQGYAGATQR